MSTEFVLHTDGEKQVELVESSAKFDLDLYGYAKEPESAGEEVPLVWPTIHDRRRYP